MQHLAIVFGDIRDGEDVLVRLHTENVAGDVFSAARPVRRFMEKIASAKRGVIVYLREGSVGVGPQTTIASSAMAAKAMNRPRPATANGWKSASAHRSSRSRHQFDPADGVPRASLCRPRRLRHQDRPHGAHLMFVLHVGPHKTATTWLQHNFHANAALSKTRLALSPDGRTRARRPSRSLRPSRPNPGRRLRKSRRNPPHRGEGARPGPEPASVVRGFRNWTPEHIERLRDLVGQDMRIVYCLRDPASLFYSFWAQKIKTARNRRFRPIESGTSKSRRSRGSSIR